MAALESYLEVMGTTGIYGERLELHALASLLNVPIHVYYFDGEEADAVETDGAAAPQPNEKILPPGVEPSGEAMKLLHLVHERHFELLLPA